VILRRIAAWFGVAAALSAVAAGAGQAADKVVRASLNTELQVLDPIVTTINATRVFAYQSGLVLRRGPGRVAATLRGEHR
jgi:peptide/nickel transport system substrate-binding protein